jgi:hypothetical protein
MMELILLGLGFRYLGGFLFSIEFLMLSSMQLCYPISRNAGNFKKYFLFILNDLKCYRSAT